MHRLPFLKRKVPQKKDAESLSGWKKKPQKMLVIRSTCSLRCSFFEWKAKPACDNIHFAWEVVPATEQNVTGSKCLPES